MSKTTFEDEQAFRKLSWQWAKAYDEKDWALLKSICSPEFTQDYSNLNSAMSKKTTTVDEYVGTFSKRTELGDERLQTQHLLGGAIFDVTSSTTAIGHWQVHAYHFRDLKDGSRAQWEAANYVDHVYERSGPDGEWKFAGITPFKPFFQIGGLRDVIGDFP